MFQLFTVNSKPINHKVYKYLCQYWQPIAANKLQRHIVRIAQWLDHTSGTKVIQLGYSPKNQQQLSLPLKKNHQNWWLEDDPFILKWSFFWDMLVFRGGTLVVKYSLGWFFCHRIAPRKWGGYVASSFIVYFGSHCLRRSDELGLACGIKSPSHHIYYQVSFTTSQLFHFDRKQGLFLSGSLSRWLSVMMFGGLENQWLFLVAYNPPEGKDYKWYILPIGGLYATYHLLGEPETTIE